MKKIEIKAGHEAGVTLFGYDPDAAFPFSRLPQMRVYNDGDETYVNLTERDVDRLIAALREVKETFSETRP